MADSAKVDSANLGGTAIKPVGWDRTGWEAFRYILYDPDNGTVLTRTPLSWLKITVFYIIYYAFLTGFWVGCLMIFFQTLPDPINGPRWKKDDGLIGNNPGVGLRPRNADVRIDSQMFVLKNGDTNPFMSEKIGNLKGEGDLNADYAERVTRFLEVYNKTIAQGYTQFKPSDLGFCGIPPYGYVVKSADEEISPCIFIKLNNIWGWSPKPIVCSPTEPTLDCPKEVSEHVLGDEGIKKVTKDNIWINCYGRNPADKEALKNGKGLTYYPTSRSIPIKYFPYMGQKNQENPLMGYHPPLVAVKINPNPELKGQLIHVECRAYFAGAVHDTKDKLGLVQFEVQII